MNKEEAQLLAKKTAELFLDAFAALNSQNFHDEVRAMTISSMAYGLASLNPSVRVLALADILEIFSRVGHEVYEDGGDLFDALMEERE